MQSLRAPTGSPISGHCISTVNRAYLLEVSDSPVLADKCLEADVRVVDRNPKIERASDSQVKRGMTKRLTDRNCYLRNLLDWCFDTLRCCIADLASLPKPLIVATEGLFSALLAMSVFVARKGSASQLERCFGVQRSWRHAARYN